MKALIKRHQVATWERGMINPYTTMQDFIDKIYEEFIEFRNANEFNEISDSGLNLSADMAHEATDMIATVINMMTFYGVDFIEEYQKNVEHQESRVIHIGSKETK